VPIQDETGDGDEIGDAGTKPTPETPAEALARAASHARAAGAEIAASLHALLDAASLGAAGAPGAETVAPLASALDALEGWLQQEGPGGGELIAVLLGALEEEIARWEGRGHEDADARAVLRAFLGLREILWELGMRAPRHGAPPAPPDAKPEEPPARRKPRKARLQRVQVEG